MDIEKEILKHVISAMIDECAGIYPKSIVGKYKKRTKYMEGWNAALIEQAKLEAELLDDLGIEVKDDENCLDPPIIDIKR